MTRNECDTTAAEIAALKAKIGAARLVYCRAVSTAEADLYALEMRFPCSFCKAAPGEACKKPSGVRRGSHAERRVAAGTKYP